MDPADLKESLSNEEELEWRQSAETYFRVRQAAVHATILYYILGIFAAVPLLFLILDAIGNEPGMKHPMLIMFAILNTVFAIMPLRVIPLDRVGPHKEVDQILLRVLAEPLPVQNMTLSAKMALLRAMLKPR
jgi:hypothetical protein